MYNPERMVSSATSTGFCCGKVVFEIVVEVCLRRIDIVSQDHYRFRASHLYYVHLTVETEEDKSNADSLP